MNAGIFNPELIPILRSLELLGVHEDSMWVKVFMYFSFHWGKMYIQWNAQILYVQFEIFSFANENIHVTTTPMKVFPPDMSLIPEVSLYLFPGNLHPQ